MQVRELMQPHVYTVAPDDTWATAVQLMLWAGIRHLPVVEAGRVVGLLSDREAIAARTSGALTLAVGESVAGPLLTTNPEEDAAEVIARMLAAKADALPVVESGRLVGMVTTTDILTHVLGGEIGPMVPTPRFGSIADAMTRDPDTAAFDDLLLDAVGRMRRRGVRHLPVIDGDHHVVGMLSDRDIRTALGDLFVAGSDRFLPSRIQLLRVADVASRGPLVVREDSGLGEAARLFADQRIGALPVVDRGGRLTGILSYVDVLAATAAAVMPGHGAPAEGAGAPVHH